MATTSTHSTDVERTAPDYDTVTPRLQPRQNGAKNYPVTKTRGTQYGLVESPISRKGFRCERVNHYTGLTFSPGLRVETRLFLHCSLIGARRKYLRSRSSRAPGPVRRAKLIRRSESGVFRIFSHERESSAD